MPNPKKGPKKPSRPGRSSKATAKKAAGTKKTAGRKTAAARKPSTGRKRAAAQKKTSARKRGAAPKKTSGRKRSGQRPTASAFLLRETLTVLAGVALGLLLTAGVLWMRANRDVQAFLADPRRPVPTVVWSAPVEIRAGQEARVSELAGDLLAAGYERVEHLERHGQFTVEGPRLALWTEPLSGPGFEVPGGRATVVIEDGVVTDTGGALVVARPTNLATLGDLDAQRTPVELDSLSPWVEPAILSMEDRRFRAHRGVDPFGIARALWANLRGRGNPQGGSTITQQLAKNLFLSSERTLQRKVREAFFATALESHLSKDRILEVYLAEVYLGQVGGVPVHGVEQAARGWFGVSAAHLDLGQAATIAGVIASPNTWSPVRHSDRAVERRDLVLRQMAENGAITPAEAKAVISTPLRVAGTLTGPVRRAPWAVDAAVDEVEAVLGDGPVEGWQVHTHIQPLLQRAAERAVAAGMLELDRDYPLAAGAEVALVAVRVEGGAVVAMVGGRDYRRSPFNRATRAWRQPGSTVKPLTLLAAFDRNPALNPVSKVVDEPISRQEGTDQTWSPRNYDGTFLGEITLRQAIEHSRNIPAVKLAEEVGSEDLQTFYRDSGLSRATAWRSAALGAFEATPMEMAGAYTVFPGGGSRARPWLVRSAAKRHNDAIRYWEPDQAELASARAAALATSVLQGVITDGTGARARRYGVTGAVGGKTGTTDDYRDAWFVGFTPDLAVAVWVGRDRGEALGLSGSRAALPTWARFVVASGTSSGTLPRPEGLQTVEVCTESHQVARDACLSTYPELFAEGHLPRERCDQHGMLQKEIGRLFDLFGHRKRAEVQGDAP